MTFKLFFAKKGLRGCNVWSGDGLVPGIRFFRAVVRGRGRPRSFLGSALALMLFGPGCRSLPPLPPANFAEPGWTVREGQAVWRAKRGAPEIAGEILVAVYGNSSGTIFPEVTGEVGNPSHRDCRTFVQFTKTPFPFVIARTETNSWQIEMPVQNNRYSGHGHPPSRVIWFLLPRVIEGSPPPKGWSWQAGKDNRWRLEERSTGDSLEGYFTQ